MYGRPIDQFWLLAATTGNNAARSLSLEPPDDRAMRQRVVTGLSL